jgi:uncharacterized protein (DUF362 family)
VDGIISGSYEKAIDLGNGHWMPVWKPYRTGIVVAGTDPVAIDTISAKIIGYCPRRYP